MMSFLIPIFMFVASFGIFFGYITGGYDDVKVRQAEIAQYDEALARFEELNRIRDGLSATYRTFSADDIDKLLALLPDNLDNIRFALDLDKIAKDNNVKISDLSLQKEDDPTEGALIGSEPVDRPTLKTAMMDFTVEASYEDMIAFLKDLEQNLRLADIVKFSFSEGKEQGADSYAISIRMYWLK